MLQRSMRSQLARIKTRLSSGAWFVQVRGKRSSMATKYPGPSLKYVDRVDDLLNILPEGEKHWFCGGVRSAAVAVEALRRNEIIAVPTDTIYGFAVMAQSARAVAALYDVKGRDAKKPLAITLSSVTDIEHWASIDHLPFRLLTDLLPGPVTIVLKRTAQLNDRLNPNHESVGIRVPRSKFIRHVCSIIGEPLALTSANVSNQPSSVHPDEFADLWPRLGAIFYDIPVKDALRQPQRIGSTVVDLTVPGRFEILRKGVRYGQDLAILRHYYKTKKSEIINDDSVIDDDVIAVRESQK